MNAAINKTQIRADVRKARRIFAAVCGEHDAVYVRISKSNALYLLITSAESGFSYRIDTDGDLMIDKSLTYCSREE